MANRPIKIKIDVMKIAKAHLYDGKNGAKYLNCAVWPNKNGPGQYGDTHYIVQELSREAQDAGQKGEIIGNMTIPDGGEQPKRTANPVRNFPRPPAPQDPIDSEPIPF